MKNKWNKARLKEYLAGNKAALHTRSARAGGYSFVLSLIVLAILVAVNVLAQALPTKWTQFDISAAQLYSLTSDTKAVVTNLQQDVTIYWITQAGEEDLVVEKLLQRYSELPSHITVVKKNPDIYPTFAQQYTSDTVYNNSLVVECGEKYRYIGYEDIYQYDAMSYYTTGSASSSFDGEGAVTSAISYVVSEELPQIYLLTGHGEAELSETFAAELERSNMETAELSLLNVDEIPQDCDAILINAPTSDISQEEQAMLQEYLQGGGRLLVLSGPQQETELTNLYAILEGYGVSAAQGIVVDTDREHYAFSAPYILMPELGSSDITAPLEESGHHVIVPIAQGLTTSEEAAGATVTPLLETSSDAFSKISGYGMTTYEEEDGDIGGPFALAVSVEDASAGGKLVWAASDYLLDDLYNSYSSGANLDFAMNSLSWMMGQQDAISIRSKSLDYNYLTISAGAATALKVFMIGVVPLAYLLVGVDEVLRRRKMA